MIEDQPAMVEGEDAEIEATQGYAAGAETLAAAAVFGRDGLRTVPT
jgi:hypothetical protein